MLPFLQSVSTTKILVDCHIPPKKTSEGTCFVLLQEACAMGFERSPNATSLSFHENYPGSHNHHSMLWKDEIYSNFVTGIS